MDCPGSLDTTLGELGDQFNRQLQDRRYPIGGSFEITERCNLRCLHCFINQPAGDRQAKERELSLPQIKRILDQAADAGCLFLLLTGGEPLLRPDFEGIYRYAKQKGLLISLFTNGTLLTPHIADLLAEWRPHTIEITLYGATQQTYERVTGVPGSHAHCMRGIELALQRGLRLGLKSVLMQANRHELGAMKAFAQKLGVDFRFDGVLFPRLDGGQAPVSQRLPAADVIALDSEYPERREELVKFYRRFGAVQARTEHVFSCGAGTRSFHIDASGRMSLCMMARRPAYDLLRGSFHEGWTDVFGSALQKTRVLDTACTSCSAGVLCVQCPGWSQMVHGDDETPAAYICDLGRLRAAQTISAAGAGPRDDELARSEE